MRYGSFVTCVQGIPYHKMSPSCGKNEPTPNFVDHLFLMELYEFEMCDFQHTLSRDGRQHGHVWRIVGADGSKRNSANANIPLWFISESQLDAFYNKHKHLFHKEFINC